MISPEIGRRPVDVAMLKQCVAPHASVENGQYSAELILGGSIQK